jgi:hypothetical protein
LTHENKKTEFIVLPPELMAKANAYLANDSFGYESIEEFVRDAVRRHIELMGEVNL